MLDPESFRCTKCGECCKSTIVWVTEKDIRKIEGIGFKRQAFAERDSHLGPNVSVLRKKEFGGACVFLKESDDGIYSCSIYKHRPEVCRQYPFFGFPVEDCKPATFLKAMANHQISKNINVKFAQR